MNANKKPRQFSDGTKPIYPPVLTSDADTASDPKTPWPAEILELEHRTAEQMDIIYGDN